VNTVPSTVATASFRKSETMSRTCEWCGSPVAWFGVPQVAELLGIAEANIRKMCREGRFNGATRVYKAVSPKGAWHIPISMVLPLVELRHAQESSIPATSSILAERA
jgi:hypothetical protein